MDIKVIQDIIDELEGKSPELLVHMERTAMYSLATAKRLNLDIEEKELAYFAGFLHDVGKIKTPIEVLEKEELSNEELKLIREHIFYGSNLLEYKEGFKKIANLINTHQEKFDGTGFPGKFKGENIPLISRITHIADAYDVMRYKKGMKHQDVIVEMRNNADTQFDRELIEHFIRAIVKERLLKLETLEGLMD